MQVVRPTSRDERRRYNCALQLLLMQHLRHVVHGGHLAQTDGHTVSRRTGAQGVEAD